MAADQGDMLKNIRQRMLELLRALHAGGVTLVAGTDQAVPGYSVYRELELYVEAGFTPLEALQAATIVPARAMHVDADSGTVEAGKRADFAILDKDPSPTSTTSGRSVRSSPAAPCTNRRPSGHRSGSPLAKALAHGSWLEAELHAVRMPCALRLRQSRSVCSPLDNLEVSTLF